MDYGFLITFTSDLENMYTRVKVHLQESTRSFRSQHVHLLNWLYAIMHTNLGPGLLIFTPADRDLS